MKRSLLLVGFLLLTSCAAIKDLQNSINTLSRLEFKLGNVNGFRLAGVDISRIADPKQLSVLDAAALASAFARKSVPATFTLNVEAKNPNTGTAGTKKSAVTLKDLEWRLLIDDKQTIGGNLGAPVQVPDNGQTTTLPLPVTLDLYTFFAEKGYDGIVKLATALGGAQGSAARLKLDAMPTVGTPIGPITYPGRITIVDKEFRGK